MPGLARAPLHKDWQDWPQRQIRQSGDWRSREMHGAAPWCAKMLSTMLTGSELRLFRKSLLGWFREFQRDLPWRRDKDAYRVWLSEIMLQQTRVAAVIPYYERFLERFPTVIALAEAPTEAVLERWSGLGYYSRAKNLQRAARQIIARHAGTFPADTDAALAL